MLRRLELTAGAPKYAKTACGIWSSNQAIRAALADPPAARRRVGGLADPRK
jgi:hypothetical protein